jgi:hypothetical protein
MGFGVTVVRWWLRMAGDRRGVVDMDVHRMSHLPGVVLKSSQVLVPAVAARLTGPLGADGESGPGRPPWKEPPHQVSTHLPPPSTSLHPLERRQLFRSREPSSGIIRPAQNDTGLTMQTCGSFQVLCCGKPSHTWIPLSASMSNYHQKLWLRCVYFTNGDRTTPSSLWTSI